VLPLPLSFIPWTNRSKNDDNDLEWTVSEGATFHHGRPPVILLNDGYSRKVNQFEEAFSSNVKKILRKCGQRQVGDKK